MKNIMTIDLEEWFHFNTSNVEISKDVYSKVRVVDATKVILDLFEQYKVKATFFCLEYVASKHPDLIKLISEKGHEIASHSINHKLVYEQTPEEFEQEIKKSVDVLEQITGKRVLGFRAPSWSITKKSLWALQVLQDLGLKYDASVFPIKTFLYGIPDAPRKPYYPEYNGKRLEILEIPMSTLGIFGKRLPFSGGFYFRVLPKFFVKWGIRHLNNQNRQVLFYLHPKEVDRDCPKISELDLKNKIILYAGIKNCKKKFENILQNFEFDSIENQLNNMEFSATIL